MRKADVIAYYGSQQELARVLKKAPSTISEWPDPIPLEAAFILERLPTKRRKPLRIDFSMYPNVPDKLRHCA